MKCWVNQHRVRQRKLSCAGPVLPMILNGPAQRLFNVCPSPSAWMCAVFSQMFRPGRVCHSVTCQGFGVDA